MFEQTFIREDAHDKKRYTMMVSLSLQVFTLVALAAAPLIYTQVLPQAHLRSVFGAPTPPPPALPKAPPTTVRSVSAPPTFRAPTMVAVARPVVRNEWTSLASPTPDIQAGPPTGDSSLPIGSPDGFQVKPPDPPQPPVARQPAKRVVVSGSVEESRLIHKVQPAYPALAVQIRVQGSVEFTAVISKAGTIENLQLVRGHPLLVGAARDAILQWRYKPTLLSGEPVEVITNITVNFTLNQQ